MKHREGNYRAYLSVLPEGNEQIAEILDMLVDEISELSARIDQLENETEN